MDSKKIKILHVEDLPPCREAVSKAARENGWGYVGVPTGEEALELIQKEAFDVVLMDIQLAGRLNGYETAEKMLESYPEQLIFSSSSRMIDPAKDYLFQAHLGKISGKEALREALADFLK